MSKIDVQAPSENEEFDTANPTITNEASTPAAEEMPSLATESDAESPEPTTAADAPTETPESDAPTEVEPLDEPEAKESKASAPVAVAESAKPTSGSGHVRRPFGRLLLEAVLAIAVVALSLWSWNLYTDKKNLQEQLSKVNANPQALVEKQTKDVLTKVGALMQLPAGETPTIAAVTDAAQAKQQSAFFANAQNGDKVLMYVKAGEAILYRPSTNKIILVAPLTFNNTTTGTAAKN